MRYSIPVIVVVVSWFAAPVASAQTWESLDPQPQSNTLWKVDFVDANYGWACGENGTILHTSDGGSTWESQTSGTSLGIVNIRFVDTQNGWAVCGSTGYGGAILNTTNGGATWTTQISGTTYSFFCPLAALSRVDCWTADGYCDLMYTTDGGGTWTHRNICAPGPWPGGWIYGVTFTDAGHGWLVGGGAVGPSAVLHTADGGVSWSQQTAPPAGEFDGVVFVGSNNGWIWGAPHWSSSSGGFILHTTNGGATWTLQQSNEPYNLRELFFLDTMNGWGAGTGGTIVRTTDGGDSWIVEQTNTVRFLNGVHFSDARHGWAVGQSGVMLRYIPDVTGVCDGVTTPRFVLVQNHPNPFNPSTTIRFDLLAAGPVRLSVHDVAGRLIRLLVDSDLPAGSHEAAWDGRDSAGHSVSSGTYVARFLAPGREATVKMNLVR